MARSGHFNHQRHARQQAQFFAQVEAEREAMRREGEPIREICLICGMVANIDPSFHHSRYGHLPEVTRDGLRCRFDYHYYAFRPLKGAGR